MHIIEIPDKNKTIPIPAGWDDCTPEQGQYLLRYAFDVMDGRLSIGAFRTKVFKYLTGLKVGFAYHVRQRLKLNNEVNSIIYLLSEQLCSWIFTKQEDDTFELNFETVINFFPVLANNQYGPADLLADMTLGEFKTVISIVDQYFDTKEDEVMAMEHIDLFLAMIYRPKANGVRIPFHKHVPDPTVFAKVPLWQKQCIVIWFTYCVKCLQAEELTINGIDVDLSVLFPKNESGTGGRKVNLGWTGVLLDIAESGVFGDAAHASQTPLYDVLIFLLKKHQDQKAHDNRKTV